MEAALDALRSPGARWLALTGEPGTGKTRLLAELGDRARARDHLVLAGRGSELERELPFGIWVAALDDHVAMLGPDRVEALVGDRAAELARVLPSAAGSRDVPLGGLQDERFRAHRAVRALLAGLAARTPVVLILDDIHWADEASLELIVHLLRRPAPARILTALAFREGQLPPVGARGARGGHAREQPRRAAADAVVRRRGGRADGRPGAGARPRGGVPPERRQPVLPAGAGPRVAARPRRPACRLRCPPRSGRRSTAWATSRGGWRGERRSRAIRRSSISPPPPRGSARSRRSPHSRSWWRATCCGATTVPRRYAFRHPIVRRAVYEAAGEAWRLGAHARAAAALAERPSALAARAHHVEHSARVGDEAAAAILEQAARQATARAPAVAARWLSAALRLLPDGNAERRLGMLVPLATALAASGRLEEALDTLLETLEQIPPEQAELRVRLVAACASCENALGRHDAAHARLLHALRRVPRRRQRQRGRAAGRARRRRALRQRLRRDAAMGRAGGADGGGARRSRDCSRSARRSCASPSTRCGGAGHAAAGPRSRAPPGSTRSPTSCSPPGSTCRTTLGFAEYFCERYDDAARHLRRGIALARAVGQGQFVRADDGRAGPGARAPRAPARGAEHRGGGGRGQPPERQPAGAWASRSSRRRGPPRSSATSSTPARPADEAVALLSSLDQSVLTQATHAHVGVIWLEIGEPDRCIEQLRAAGLPDFPLIEPGRRGWLYTVLARAELEGGDRAAAAEWLARGEETVRGLELPLAEAWVLHARSLLTLADGDAAEAAALALRAAERAEAVQRAGPGRALPDAGRRRAGAGGRQRAGGAAADRAPSARSRPARPTATATRPRATSAASASGSARASAASAGPGPRRAQRSRARDRRPRGARMPPTGRSPTSCSSPRRRSRATSPACSPSSASRRAPRWPRRSAARARRSPEQVSNLCGRTGGSPQYMTPTRRNTMLIRSDSSPSRPPTIPGAPTTRARPPAVDVGRLTRWVALAVIFFLADAVQLLLLLPDRTGELFAWAIDAADHLARPRLPPTSPAPTSSSAS